MRTLLILVATLGIVIGGCADVPPPATPGADPTPGTATQTDPPGPASPAASTPEPPEEEPPASADPNTEPPREPSAFARRDTAPGGVAQFLDSIPGGGIEGPCVVNPPEELPGIAMHQTVIPTSLCGQGFVAGQEVALTVRGPGGREWTAQVTPNDDGAFEWGFERLPGRLEGEYLGRAVQGEVTVEGTFQVSLDSLSAAVVPRYFPPGSSTELVIAGGEAGQSVPVHLYRERSSGGRWRFIADLGPLTLDGNGQVRLELDSRRRDERGTFMVVVDPDGERIGYWFVLGRSGGPQ